MADYSQMVECNHVKPRENGCIHATQIKIMPKHKQGLYRVLSIACRRL